MTPTATASSNPYAVDLQMAQRVATRQYEIQIEDANANQPTKSARVAAPQARTIRKTDAVKDGNETLFHVINYDQGFVIVSGDRRTVPVLAYSETGSFELNEAPDGVKHWIDFAQDQIKRVKASVKKPAKVIDKIWERYLQTGLFITKKARTAAGCPDPEYFSRGPLVPTKWGQRAGYNYYCPDRDRIDCPCGKALAGCGAVAVGQIMAFWRFPNQGRHEAFNWNLMLADSSVTNTCGTLGEGDRLVARLLNDVGEWANSHYYNNPFNCNTYTWSGNLDEAFQAAGYSNRGNLINFYDNLESLRGLLRSGYPFILIGTTCDIYECSVSEQIADAHIFICDGYQYSMYYEEVDSGGGRGTFCNGFGYELFSINWGYGGRWDAWYASHDFTNGDAPDRRTYKHWMRAQAYMHP